MGAGRHSQPPLAGCWPLCLGLHQFSVPQTESTKGLLDMSSDSFFAGSANGTTVVSC